jgi:hypothetical protein
MIPSLTLDRILPLPINKGFLGRKPRLFPPPFVSLPGIMPMRKGGMMKKRRGKGKAKK